MRQILVILISLFLTACQATTGHLLGKGTDKSSPSCETIPTADASVNWAVFGRVKRVRNCPGRSNQYQERYSLANGWGIYQEANMDLVYFYETTERSFREALARNSAFSDTASTIKIHNPNLKNRYAMFAQKKCQGKTQFILE